MGDEDQRQVFGRQRLDRCDRRKRDILAVTAFAPGNTPGFIGGTQLFLHASTDLGSPVLERVVHSVHLPVGQNASCGTGSAGTPLSPRTKQEGRWQSDGPGMRLAPEAPITGMWRELRARARPPPFTARRVLLYSFRRNADTWLAYRRVD